MPDKKDKLMSSGQQPEAQQPGEEKQKISDLAAEALEYNQAPSDSALYELKDVEDSPVGGHQEQVLKDQG